MKAGDWALVVIGTAAAGAGVVWFRKGWFAFNAIPVTRAMFPVWKASGSITVGKYRELGGSAKAFVEGRGTYPVKMPDGKFYKFDDIDVARAALS